MKRGAVIILLALILLLIARSPLVKAGLMIAEQAITLKPGDMIERCGMVCVWEPAGNASYTVEITGLDEFVDKVEPSSFRLEPVPCPKEPQARRECIARECMNPESKSAMSLCIYFSAPVRYVFELCDGLPCEPKMEEHIGAVRAFRRVGAAVGVEPMRFVVYYTPANGWPIVYATTALITFVTVGLFVYFKKLKPRLA